MPIAAGFVNIIVPDSISAEGIIAPGIDRADVASFERNMMNIIELDQVIVAAEKHGRVRMVVNEIMRSALANAGDQDRWNVAFGPSTLT